MSPDALIYEKSESVLSLFVARTLHAYHWRKSMYALGQKTFADVAHRAHSHTPCRAPPKQSQNSNLTIPIDSAWLQCIVPCAKTISKCKFGMEVWKWKIQYATFICIRTTGSLLEKDEQAMAFVCIKHQCMFIRSCQ